MRNFTLLSFLLAGFFLYSQDKEYNSGTIPDVLKKNADAVVLLDEVAIIIDDRDKMTVQNKRVVTVLNKSGNSAVRNYAFYDGVTKLKDLSAELFDANGNSVQEIKKHDFKDIAAVDGISIYTDSRYQYFEYTPLAYPYTISFTYSYNTPNTAFIPPWIPIDKFNVSVKKSNYKITYPEAFKIRTKKNNFDSYSIEERSAGNVIDLQLTNAPAIKEEMLSPPFSDMAPNFILALNEFHLEGLDGYGADWKNFGKWQYDHLLENRDIVSPETINYVRMLVAGVDDPLEKTKLIYKYVQEHTRYISVQLGIGGWMPIQAEEVDRVKYGDCKGLTNYTKALLKTQGITSFYSVVWAGDSKRNMEPDFASMQGNHVILNVPIKDQEIWLECTSQEIPFGFLGDFTDDRDVLVVTEDGGILKRTESYLDTINKKITKAYLEITDQGMLKGKVMLRSEGIEYSDRFGISRLSEKKKDETYKEYWGYLNGLVIDEMIQIDDRVNVVFEENVVMEVPSYANTVGNDLIFKLNAFDVTNFIPTRYADRKQPFEISRGFLHEASSSITIPEGFNIKDLPAPVAITTIFGTYEMTVEKVSKQEFTYQRKLLIKEGLHPKEAYNVYRDFRRTIAKQDNTKIILTKI